MKPKEPVERGPRCQWVDPRGVELRIEERTVDIAVSTGYKQEHSVSKEPGKEKL